MSTLQEVETQKFTVFKINRGYLLTTYINKKSTSYVFAEDERFRLFAYIDSFMGPEPKTNNQTNWKD